jgi:hypothetical protein
MGDIGIKVALHVTFCCGGKKYKSLNCRVIRLHYVLRALGVLVEYFMRTAWWELFVLIRNERPYNAGSRLHFTSVHIASSSPKSSSLSCVWHTCYCVCVVLLLFCTLYPLHIRVSAVLQYRLSSRSESRSLSILRPAYKHLSILLWRCRSVFPNLFDVAVTLTSLFISHGTPWGKHQFF